MSFLFLLLVVSLIFLGVIYILLTRNNVPPARHLRLNRLHEQTDVLLETLGLKPDGQLPLDVARLVHDGQKLEAIKLYRERTGVGLKAAKDAVEVEEGLDAVERKLDRVLRELNVTETRRETSPSVKTAPAALDEIESLVRQDRLIDAIKTYRDVHGGGLREAKDAVEQIQLRHRNR